jgi:hypothetical protein
MKISNIEKGVGTMLLVTLIGLSCTNLNQKVYSVVPNAEFWQTPAQIAAGVAPAYNVLTQIPNGSIEELVEASTDEMIIPIRGSDWLDADEHVQEWQHTWPDNHPNISSAWGTIFQGIGEANFTIGVVQGLPKPPSDTTAIYAELRGLRAYYYFLALDLFGNVPIVTSFNVDPTSVKTANRTDVFNFVQSELLAILPNLASNVDATTYGRFTKYAAFSLLAKLYLNAQVYNEDGYSPGTPGSTPMWTQCMAMCDSVILSGQYGLESNFFDNFSPTNSNLTSNGNENIFVVPFDKVNIGGDNWEMGTLHYQNNVNFQLSGSPWNGFCSDADFYSKFDTTSIYNAKGTTVYRTYLDQRAGQYLIGQQYSIPYTYPPSTNVVYSADNSLALQDVQFSIPLIFTPAVTTLSNAAGAFRGAGVRDIKYFPEQGTSGNQSNDMVIFRLADIYLMRAEADMRANGTISATSLGYVNKVRERAYGTTTATISNPDNAAQPIQVDWTNSVTLPNILDERGRELTWECWRRNDLIRFEIASGTTYWSGPRNPEKTQDADNHFMLFPIPTQYITANPNQKQNTGY